MAKEIKRLDEGEARQLALTMADFKELLRKPILLLPVPLREPVLKLWTCTRCLGNNETPLCIAANLAVWIADFGLTEGDAIGVVIRHLGPESRASTKFASDLIGSMAADVANITARRKREAEQEQRRALDLAARAQVEQAARAGGPTPLERLAEMEKKRRAALDGIGVSPAPQPPPNANTEAERQRAAEAVRRMALDGRDNPPAV